MSEAVGSSDGEGADVGGISSDGGVWGGGGDSCLVDANPVSNEIVEQLLANADERAREAWNYNGREALSRKEIEVLSDASVVLAVARETSNVAYHLIAKQDGGGSAGGSVKADSDGNLKADMDIKYSGTTDKGTEYEFGGKVEVKRDSEGRLSADVGLGGRVGF